MHNLSIVYFFEIVRTLKKKTFWITALSFPVVIAAVLAIIFFSNKTTNDLAESTQKQTFSFAVTDESGLLTPAVLTTAKAHVVSPADKQSTINKVKTGTLDAYFYYPTDVGRQSVQVYARDVGLFDNSRYEATANSLLSFSVSSRVSSQIATVLQHNVHYDSTTYKDGRPFNGFAQLILPGVFVVLFYILISFFGNQMLTSTTEEKENRVIEMILTTIEARTLIVGKIFSLITLAFIQIIVILVPLIVLYVLLSSQLSLPNVDLAHLPVDGGRIAIGGILFTCSFLFFTGLLVSIGAAAPTAKEASSFFGLVITLIFGPLYAISLFISAPESTLVQILSYFPLTAPIPLLFRNAVGNLTLPEASIGIVILAVSAFISLSIAIRLFRFGALEYSRRLSLKEIFIRKS